MSQSQTDRKVAEPRPAEFLKVRRLAEMLDISTRTLYRKVARGEFPKPVRIGKGTTRWRLRDIEAYLVRAQKGVERERGRDCH